MGYDSGMELFWSLLLLIDNFSPRVMELYATCLSFQLIRNGGYSHVVLEMDTLKVVSCLSSSNDW